MANQNNGCVFLSPIAIVMFIVAISQQATVHPPNILKLAHTLVCIDMAWSLPNCRFCKLPGEL